MTEQMSTVIRYLIDNGIDMTTFRVNINDKDGSTMLFRLELAGCRTEKEVINLINRYV